MVPQGLFEGHLNVRDLGRSISFYRDIVGLRLAHVAESRAVAFFWVGRPGRSMLGLWLAGQSPQAMRLHLAFSLELDDVIASPANLRGLGVPPLNFHGQPTTEPSVVGWMPAACVYFKDPDDNLLEFLAMLPDTPRPEVGIVTYSEWVGTRISRADAEASGAL